MRKIILMGFPLHINLGDQAIAMAEEEFIKKNFPEYEYYAVPEENMIKCAEIVKKFCTEDDILVLHGGGNFGNEYMYIEEGRRKIFELFPNNPIILMPQSIHFSNDEKGEEELEKSIEAYNKHNNLTLVAREQVSYDKIKEKFNVELLFTPDIVMSLNKQKFDETRNGLMYVLRNDVEKVLTDEKREYLLEVGKKYFSNIKMADMLYDKKMNVYYRDNILNSFMNEFSKRELVITDRLHGMIFSAITGTPCIAFSNYNHKVKSSFKWLENLGYIKFLDDVYQVEDAIKELRKIKETKYDNKHIMEGLQPIIDKIKSF